MIFIFGALYIIAIALEATITTIPLSLMFLLCLAILKQETWIFLVAFLSGLILDTFTLRPLGQTSIFFVVFLFFLLLYKRKYEIDSLPFVVISSFFGSVLFLFVFKQGAVFPQALVSMIVAVGLFSLYRRFRKHFPKRKY